MVNWGRAVGVWGGTLDLDRRAVFHMATDEAVELLEATFLARLDRRIAAWQEAARGREEPVRRSRGRRIQAMIAARSDPIPVSPIRATEG